MTQPTPLNELQEIDEQRLAESLTTADINFTPAFVHGLLTAYCCEEHNTHAWAMTLIADIDPKNEQQTQELRHLNQVKNYIGSQLSDSELCFDLVLNNTAETLHDEVLLTREWASGYLLGASEIGLAEKVKGDDLSTEFMGDLPQIIAMPVPSDDALETASIEDEYQDNYDSTDDVYENDRGDDTRADIMEIQEYCRAGAISAFLASWKDSESE